MGLARDADWETACTKYMHILRDGEKRNSSSILILEWIEICMSRDSVHSDFVPVTTENKSSDLFYN